MHHYSLTLRFHTLTLNQISHVSSLNLSHTQQEQQFRKHKKGQKEKNAETRQSQRFESLTELKTFWIFLDLFASSSLAHSTFKLKSSSSQQVGLSPLFCPSSCCKHVGFYLRNQSPKIGGFYTSFVSFNIGFESQGS